MPWDGAAHYVHRGNCSGTMLADRYATDTGSPRITGDNTPGAIPERELRLALVSYGGVSLAVYMHGITRGILKLARASRAYHALA